MTANKELTCERSESGAAAYWLSRRASPEPTRHQIGCQRVAPRPGEPDRGHTTAYVFLLRLGSRKQGSIQIGQNRAIWDFQFGGIRANWRSGTPFPVVISSKCRFNRQLRDDYVMGSRIGAGEWFGMVVGSVGWNDGRMTWGGSGS
ncbi:MAG: hypothetical protein Q8O19_04035 [Rectinemataceae bacterium]|nr:hypothetical protein [Rectinemataceae bacterium]